MLFRSSQMFSALICHQCETGAVLQTFSGPVELTASLSRRHCPITKSTLCLGDDNYSFRTKSWGVSQAEHTYSPCPPAIWLLQAQNMKSQMCMRGAEIRRYNQSESKGVKSRNGNLLKSCGWTNMGTGAPPNKAASPVP